MLDLLQVLKEHEANPAKKKIFDNHYSDIILVFDLDPQDPRFSPEAIISMAEYFTESSDNGKLYLNYPMVESFYHMNSIPDLSFNSYVATMDELRQGSYKSNVKKICRIPYKNFATTKNETDIIIMQNLDKARNICDREDFITDTDLILRKQLSSLIHDKRLYVLCTCVFYIRDYNPSLLS